MESWTFLTNRAPVLLCVAHNPDAPARHRGQPELRPRRNAPSARSWPFWPAVTRPRP